MAGTTSLMITTRSFWWLMTFGLPSVLLADGPEVTAFFPPGLQRGSTVELKASGKFENWPVNVHVDRPGLTIDPLDDNGLFRVTAATDAVPGSYWVRCYNDRGASSLRPLLVGVLAELVEVEPNNSPVEAQEIDSTSVVVNGRLNQSGDVDGFAVDLEARQTLVIRVEAHQKLGSPMDGILQVVSPEGFVVDQVDDAPLFDPFLVFEVPTTGRYTVRLFAFPSDPNSSIRFAGGADYIYRLTLTTGGFIDHLEPPIIGVDLSEEEASRVLLPVGWNLPMEVSPLRVSQVTDREMVVWHPTMASVVTVRRSDVPIIRDNTLEVPPCTLPAIFSGSLQYPKETDSFKFSASKGKKIRFKAESRTLDSLADPVLRVVDQDGTVLASAGNSGGAADPTLTFDPPGDGTYQLRVTDLYNQGGLRYHYQIEARIVRPHVALSVDADHFSLKPSEPLKIALKIDRNDGFDQAIRIEARNLPEGLTTDPVTSPPEGDSSKGVTLVINGSEATPWSGPIEIVGIGEDDHTVAKTTTSLVGGSVTDQFWLTVLPKNPQ